MTKGLTMRLIPALMMLGFAGVAGASGFALQNQSGSANGNAFAGAAAAAEDASTIFFNPAGMTQMPGIQLSAGVTGVGPRFEFANDGSSGLLGTGGNGGSTNPPPGGGTILPALAYPGMVSPSVTAPQNFLEVKGVYYGLFYNSDAVDAASSGYLGVAPAANGSYSAVIRTLGRSYAFSGRFDAQGRATKVIPRPGLGTLTVTLQLDAARADMTRDDQIRGQISGPGWTAEVLANRLVYSAYRRCPYAGRYNLVIPPDATVTNGPAGYGYGLVDVDIYGTRP